MPRFVPRYFARFRLNPDRFTAARSTASALQSSPSCWPVAVISPGFSAFFARRHARDAVVADLPRRPRLEREQARVRGDHRRVLFLAAEPAARLGLHHAHPARGIPEQRLECLQYIEGALERAVEGEAAG